MRRENLADYVDADSVQPTCTYERIGSMIRETYKSVVRFIKGDSEKLLPEYMKSTCFYTKVQPYRPVPTRPLPPELKDNLKRIRKGFDP
jgi:hypothetical protein